MNKFKDANIQIAPVESIEPTMPDVLPMVVGLTDNPLEGPLDMQDVKFEDLGIRKDFGWRGVGDPAASGVLGLKEHRYIDSNGVELTRLIRLIRNPNGEAAAQIWDGVDWDLEFDSSDGGETIEDDLVSMVSTLGELFIAGGEDDILRLSETAESTKKEDDFATGLDLDAEDDSADVTLVSEPAFNNIYIVSYEVSFSFKWDGTGSPTQGALYSITVIIQISPDDSVWTTVDSQFYGLRTRDEDVAVSYDATGTSAIRRTINAQDFDLADVGYVRVLIGTVEDENTKELTSSVKPCRITGAEDSFAGVEYYTVATSGDLLTVGTDSPHAKYIFPFGDRLCALQDNSDLTDGTQTFAFSTSGIAHSDDNSAWTGDGSGLLVLQDTQGDPVNELMAGVALGHEIAAVFRRRSIMRAYRTGKAAQAIGIGSWFENIGTDSPHSVRPVRGGCMFLGSDLMAYLLTASGELLPVGAPIHDTLFENLTSNFSIVYSEYDPIFEDYTLAIPVDGGSLLTKGYVFSLKEFFDNKGKLVWRKKNYPSGITCMAVANNYSEV